jgi:hypothetical protein
VVFYLQAGPDAALPPLYRLFHTELPPPDAPRFLEQGAAFSELQAIEVCEQRCGVFL